MQKLKEETKESHKVHMKEKMAKERNSKRKNYEDEFKSGQKTIKAKQRNTKRKTDEAVFK